MTTSGVLRSLPVLALAATLPSIVLFSWSVLIGGHGLWNDFASYWLGGKLVLAGGSPFDLEALKALAAREGIVFEAGTGYSYPPPFAVAMAPLSALPFVTAGAVFTVASLAAFGVAAAVWFGDQRCWRASPPTTIMIALAAGLYPPVHNSVFFGQVNLLVFAALLLGVRAVLGSGGRRVMVGGVGVALAGIVKVAPLVVAFPLAVGRRADALIGMVVAGGGALLATWLLAPAAFEGMSRLGGLGEPDPYWTNQSINGYVSRLTLGSDRVVAIFPDVDPILLGNGLLVALGLATLIVLVRGRGSLSSAAGLGLGIGLALVAATAGAPKNSFWNHVPALLGAGLLIAAGRPRTFEVVMLAGWYGLAWFGVWFDGHGPLLDAGPIGSVLSGAPLVGLLALWVAIATRILSTRGQMAASA